MQLVLFFTKGVSLKIWSQAGMLDREIAMYDQLSKRGIEVTFVTYGNGYDWRYKNQIPQIKIVCNRWKLPEKLYVFLLPWLVRRVSGRSWIGKSNQTYGAEIGLEVAKTSGNKFIARSGYMLSLFNERKYGVHSSKAEYARALEAKVFKEADAVVVTSAEMKSEMQTRYLIEDSLLHIIPNYVETDIFKPISKKGNTIPRIISVNRLVPKKNHFALLEAIRGLDVQLDLVGEGDLKAALEDQAGRQGSDVNFLGNIPNHDLPAVLNQCDIFVHPSLYEGHPKALIEAMSCGMPVIGTDVPGTREIIEHGVNGYLCGTSGEELRAAIQILLADDDLRYKLAKNARRHVIDNYSLDQVLMKELNLIHQLGAN